MNEVVRLLLWPRLLHFPGLSITILLFLPLLVFKSLIWTGLRPLSIHWVTENNCYFCYFCFCCPFCSFCIFLSFLGSRTSKRANLPPPFCSIVTMPSSWRSKSQKLDGFRRSQQQNAPAALLRSTPETSGNAQSDSVTEIMIQSCQFYHVYSNESGEIRETREVSELISNCSPRTTVYPEQSTGQERDLERRLRWSDEWPWTEIKFRIRRYFSKSNIRKLYLVFFNDLLHAGHDAL